MALESEPQIVPIDPSAQLKTDPPPKIVFPKDPKKLSTRKASSSRKDKSTLKKDKASSSKDLDARAYKRTNVTLSAARKKLSSLQRSPLKRMRIEDSETEEVEAVVDPTLNEDGLPARNPLQNLAHIQDDEYVEQEPPAEQYYDVKSDEHYPIVRPTPKAIQLRAIEKDLRRAIVDRDDFAHFSTDEIVITAELFFDCGLSSTKDLKQTRSLNRTFMLEDLRAAKKSAKDLRLFTALLALFPPPSQLGANKKGQFVECCIPKLIQNFKADLSSLSQLITPDQLMVNDISRQLSEGEACHPAYIPFVTANMADEPWKPQLSTHDRSLGEWSSRMSSLKSSQSLSFQAYIFYSFRFILAAHMVDAWQHFGGFSAQINALAVLMNIAVVEHAGIAIAYDIALRKYLAQLARQRRTDIDFAHLLSEENPDIKKQVYANRASNNKGEDPRKGKSKGSKFQAYSQPYVPNQQTTGAASSTFQANHQNRFQKTWTPKRNFANNYRPFQKTWQQNYQKYERHQERSRKRSKGRSARRSRSHHRSSPPKKKQGRSDEKK